VDALNGSERDQLFGGLRRFVRKRPPREECELCSTALAPVHQHLIEPAARKLVCACDACAVLFGHQTGAKYRRVPRRIRSLEGFRMSDSQWDALAIPIGLAFFFRSSSLQRTVAFYPSPAGATESLLPLEAWRDIEQANPALESMDADVEALLINRVNRTPGPGGATYHVVPIDECYRLVGLIRARWSGFSGGAEVWESIGHFFRELDARAERPREAARA
jgi:hypothetical protein